MKCQKLLILTTLLLSVTQLFAQNPLQEAIIDSVVMAEDVDALTYNITVNGNHNCYVSELSLLAHNIDCPSLAHLKKYFPGILKDANPGERLVFTKPGQALGYYRAVAMYDWLAQEGIKPGTMVRFEGMEAKLLGLKRGAHLVLEDAEGKPITSLPDYSHNRMNPNAQPPDVSEVQFKVDGKWIEMPREKLDPKVFMPGAARRP